MSPRPGVTFGHRNDGLQIAYNNGPITNHHYPPGSSAQGVSGQPAQTAPRELYHEIPFARDVSGFVHRPDLMDQIDRIGRIPGSRVALTGLAGMGKSQLAIEYAYRAIDSARQESRRLWVFWIHAGSRQRFLRGFRSIATTVELPGRDGADVLQLVRKWLREATADPWLLVLDGAEASSGFSCVDSGGGGGRDGSATSQSDWDDDLCTLLPEIAHGSILITSRDEKTARYFGVEVENLVHVDRMETAHALQLLRRKFGDQVTAEDELPLVQSLDCIPLAITQAAANVQKTRQRVSASQFLKLLQSSEHEKVRLLKQDEADGRRYNSSSNSVIVLWQRSLAFLEENTPSAADLISVMAFFDGCEIPQAMLEPPRDRLDARGSSDLESRSEHDVDESNDEDGEIVEADVSSTISATLTTTVSRGRLQSDKQLLMEHHLISEHGGGTSFKMHGLVQLAVRSWLEDRGALDKFNQQFVHQLHQAFPEGRFENWSACEGLFKHAKIAMDRPPTGDLAVREWATLLHNGSVYALGTGADSLAEAMATKAHKSRGKVLGDSHPQTLASRTVVGKACRHQGRWRVAGKIFNDVRRDLKRHFPNDSAETLAVESNLAATYRDQGEWDAAQKLEEDVLAKRRRLLGDSHLDTLSSESNLASIYWLQGCPATLTEAKKMDKHVLQHRKKKLGLDHPDTLSSMIHSALTLGPDRQRQALRDLGRVLSTSTRVLGHGHPDTIIIKMHVAAISREMAVVAQDDGKLDEVETVFNEVLQESKRAFGARHPLTLDSMANLVTTYTHQGRWQEAAKLGTTVLAARTRALGRHHPDTLRSMQTLAIAYYNLKQLAEVEELEVEALEICRRHAKRDPGFLCESLEDLAFTRRAQGRLAEAVWLMEECLDLRSKIQGLEQDAQSCREVLCQWHRE